ncbi:MAG: hypothetical protein J6J18_03095 [Oscillospiraceae bacterium]|nr:hypothetical protein [Oscillospiraceae bacterium]
MAGKIRGITIEIGGDTKGLVQSLNDVDKEVKSTKQQLRDVEKLLKLDPTNTTLLAQKQKLLTQAVEQTSEKLEKLKEAQKEMDAQGIDKNSAQYMALQREIISTTQYLDDLESAAARSNATLAKVGAVADKISGGAQKVSNATRGISTAATGAITGIAGMAYNAAVMSDDLNTLAKQTGFSTAEIQKMQYAADRIDVSMETITGGAAKMTRQLIDNEEKFTDLGVATRDTDGAMRSTTDIFYDTIKALSEMDNETARDTAAMDIFGRSANELAGVIDDGGAALREYGEEMEALGLVISQETLDDLNAVNDEIDQIKAQALATFATSGATALQTLSPIISQVIGYLDQLFQKIAGLDQQQMKTILTILAIVAAVSPVAGTIAKVAGAISTLMPIMSALFTMLQANPIFMFIAAVIAAGAAIALFGDDLKAILTETDNFLQTIFAVDFTNVFGPVLGGALNEFLALVSTTWDAAKEILEGIINFCQGVFTGDWQKAWDGVGQIFSGVFNGLAGIAEAAINGVIGFVNSGIERINSFIELINKIPAVDIPTIGTIGPVNLDGQAANGGTFSRGNILVGEAGPEILTVSGGRATVTPLSGNAPHTPVQPAAIGGNLSTNVQVNFTGSLAQLAHILTPEIKAETVRVGPALVN